MDEQFSSLDLFKRTLTQKPSIFLKYCMVREVALKLLFI
jgi:hypothetical protein